MKTCLCCVIKTLDVFIYEITHWKMRIFIIVACLALIGCENVSTSKLMYQMPNGAGSLSIEFPKELKAEYFDVRIDATPDKVIATISAKQIETVNVKTIEAQAKREAGVLKQAKGLTSEISKGVASGIVAGAMKGVVP